MSKKPLIVGITGASGSGKTCFLKSFLTHFSDGEICLVSQDDYYHPVRPMSAEENKYYNFDLPEAIDESLFLSDINKLMSGETVFKKEYTFNKPGALPNILEIASAPIIMVEGLFILHFKEIASLLDLKVFIECDHEIALQRRIKRDGLERGYPEGDVRYKWDNHVLAAYDNYLLPHKDTCGKLIKNNSDLTADLNKSAAELTREIRILANRV